jgi:hypothetical protein
MDGQILQKLIDLAREEAQTYVKVDLGIWHGPSPRIDVQIHYVRDPGTITGLGSSVEEAYQDLIGKIKTGDDT